jgi:hypothetical protein
MYVCMYVCVCVFRHNYLSVNGIVSFPSFTWLYKYKEEYKQGEMSTLYLGNAGESASVIIKEEINWKIDFVPGWTISYNHVRQWNTNNPNKHWIYMVWGFRSGGYE